MREFGLKHLARELAAAQGVALLPGSGLLSGLEEARGAARKIGYPVMLKSTAGGGGIGMQLVKDESDLAEALRAVERLATKNFSRGGVFLEKYIERARHIEVQIFGNGLGEVIALGERDCSTQRRNQKIVEETPAPALSDATRSRLHAAAIRLASAVNYQSAGTVEFVYDVSKEEFYFLEVNTRLQVEHGVTEEVTGVDLVEWMIRQSAGDGFEMRAPAPRGASIEVRLYAEDPARSFRPSTGLITHARFAQDARVETWVGAGTEISPLYDPLLAKIITVGKSRPEALHKLREALGETQIAGIETNLEYLKQLVAGEVFTAGGMTTRTLETFAYAPRTLEVLAAGTQTTVQDYPGRVGYWSVGVPPSGPMDSLSFRLGNRCVGNDSDAAALEITVSGPTLRFNTDALICLTGAPVAAELDAAAAPFGFPLRFSPARYCASAPFSARDAAPTSASGAASMCRITWGAVRRLPWVSSAVTAGGRWSQAMCCTSMTPGRAGRRFRFLRRCGPTFLRTGNWAYSTVRTAPQISLPKPTSHCSSPRAGKCITTPTAPASD